VVATDLGIAERGALLPTPVDGTIEESKSTVNGPPRSTGPAPAAHSRASSSLETASSSRTLDHLWARSHDPTVDGALVSSNNTPAAPARNRAVSSMLSPPASIDPITVNAFALLFAPSAASRSRRSTRSPSPIRCANTAAGSSPAFGTRFASLKLTDTRLKS
jgi:hypothetical protein